MQRSVFLIPTLLCLALLSGCASMSKKDCLNANWEAVGYSDGSRGVHYTRLEKHRQSCVEYEVMPDDAAYRHGWEQGIRTYCTAANGYRAGQAGKNHKNVCPADVADDYMAGWRRGVRNYCTAENGLRQGLAGRSYHGICPADLEPAYRDFYQLGRDVRSARSDHQKLERSVAQKEKQLARERRPAQQRTLLHQLERLKHQESYSDAQLIALEACMSSDWFDAGYRDGEDGYPRRAGEIAAACRNYGIAADRIGYRQGWQQGVTHYCTYETGLYLGQTNQPYSGVCAGMQHQRFWQGYERGRATYRANRYEAHPRPVNRKVSQSQPKREKLPQRIEAAPEQHAPAQGGRVRDEEAHDNRDKHKHPMPEQSHRPESESHKKVRSDNDHHDKDED